MTRFRLGGEGFATAIAGFNGPEGFLETILDNDINYSKYSVYRVVIDSGLLRIWFIDKACSGMDEDQYELYSLSVEANTNIYFAIEGRGAIFERANMSPSKSVALETVGSLVNARL